MNVNVFDSKQIPHSIAIKILSLTGFSNKFYSSFDLIVTIGLTSFGQEIITPIVLPYMHNSNDIAPCWNTWIHLPYSYSSIAPDSQIIITIKGVNDENEELLVGSTTVSLFDKKKWLRSGEIKALIYPNVIPNIDNPSTTNGLININENAYSNQLAFLNTKLADLWRGTIKKSEWLDNIAFLQIEKINKAAPPLMEESLELNICFPDFGGMVEYEPMTNNFKTRKNSESSSTRLFNRLVRFNGFVIPMKVSVAERKKLKSLLRRCPTESYTGTEINLLKQWQKFAAEEENAGVVYMRITNLMNHEFPLSLQFLKESKKSSVGIIMEFFGERYTKKSVPQKSLDELHKYAIEILNSASNEILALYLLQLVQALAMMVKFRNQTPYSTLLGLFLLERCTTDINLAVKFYWHVKVITENQENSREFVEMFKDFMYEFKQSLYINNSKFSGIIQRQDEFVSSLIALGMSLPPDRLKAESILRDQLMNGYFDKYFEDPLPLPLDPSIVAKRIVPTKVKVFASARKPFLLTFETVDNSTYSIIFKTGDDMRQDEFIINMIKIINIQLKNDGFDLDLTPYSTLATSLSSGMVQCISAKGLEDILKEHGSLYSYFAGISPGVPSKGNNQNLLIHPVTQKRFVRSNAGYCIITYLLGIGDRHNDNVMISDDGKVIHIDFGFILGKDPKAFAPPMKLNGPMLEAMGGYEGKPFQTFCELCCESFVCLRRSQNMIMNLISLVMHSGYQSIDNTIEERDLMLKKCVEKFRQDLDDDQSYRYIQALINDSLTAFFPKINETIHRIAQSYR
eukprot:TRINITY_DN761_c0_g1_i1.p1 TRINITY_DN761_c0_g1~~TRINITY_DN761_c0_g1_i1.p1  ORF type:complete len:797 (-),score=211.45 TRINITY_DN761_c0_g1_i1:10-2400(-)